MPDEIFNQSQLPIRRTVDLLPTVFQTDTNAKFLAAVFDPLVQPGVLEKTVGYIGRRYGKTFKSTDIYLDTDQTLRSRYQLEPAVILKENNVIDHMYDYLDFKNQIKYFGNTNDRDDLTTSQVHYSWSPPIDWDKFVNFREYFWVPEGPPPVKILGQSSSVVSTYRVKQGDSEATWMFSPDGYTNNPTITLYRGQTYKFIVNSPNNPFAIRTAYDTNSLAFNPDKYYYAGSLVIFNEKLWRAKVDVVGDGSSINEDTQDWEFIESVFGNSSIDYNTGVTNNYTTNGTVTFTVPYEAPDVLFYQSTTNANRFGRFIVYDIESNTSINIENEIVGKKNYTSSNGVEFTNGQVVYFEGKVTPTKYAEGNWLVEGVGSSIQLKLFTDLIVPKLSIDTPEVLFDNAGFDTEPFDDASAYPGTKDYITINKASIDANPWSRYNRWFHRSVLETAHTFNNSNFDPAETDRAKRPIIEFSANLQLFNHGSRAKQTVDYVDTFTKDVFSTIEGSTGYIVDGEQLFNGARVLVIADTDSLSNNRIYQVKFIVHNSRTQISLVETADSMSTIGDGVLVRRGVNNAGLMYHYDGNDWVPSQKKTAINQPPLFDAFDSSNVSFGNVDTYPVSSFLGTKILSYKVGTSTPDSELGFSLSYLNIDNIGDIQFSFDWDVDTYTWQQNQLTITEEIDLGYYKFNNNVIGQPEEYFNGWTESDSTYDQAIIDSVVLSTATDTITFTAVDWSTVTDTNLKIVFYVNGNLFSGTYTRSGIQNKTFTFSKTFVVNDVVTIKIYSDGEPDSGYYEIPMGLERNPLNNNLTSFTLGQATEHVFSMIELTDVFVGPYPGASNLRDISKFDNLGRRFVKHSGIASAAIVLLADKEVNIIKSIQHSKKSYTDFKNNFLTLAFTKYFDQNIVDFVDELIEEMSKTKTSVDAFSDTDMIGSGAYSSIDYLVEDDGIKTFALSTRFDLSELSRKAVYVYINNKQLLVNRDYEFDKTFGFVRILTNISINDKVQIREYVSTSFSYIPSTPTSLGLYKKYTPEIIIDDTYFEPQLMIRGHDGSLTVSYGDFRDELLLELEYRIYNNIKQEYNESIFDIDAVVGGYYNTGLYSKTELDNIVNQEFLKWISDTNIDYINNTYFDSENSFSYTYSNMADPTGTKNLPGWWRGVYQWFYDTDRPHVYPWEMLGFSEKPTWWEEEYGPAPYTNNNLLLWEDLSNGIIRQGNRAGTHARYTRPTLMNHIPVDGDGKLLSPLESGLATNFTLVNNQGPFKLGDTAPVEFAWRSSSEWPFAVTMAMCLMKPFEFIVDSFDRSQTTVNNLNQTISKKSGKFITIDDMNVPIAGESQAAGLVNYIVDLLKSKGQLYTVLQNKLDSIDVRITNRISGFVDQEQQKYLLDSKSPSSTSSAVFVPQENYDIIFNISSPIDSISYSGVLLEKFQDSWKVSGYDSLFPYFKYYEAVSSQNDPLISVGGVSESFVNWDKEKFYGNGIVARYNNEYYRSISSHTSGQTFEQGYWKKLSNLPTTGAVEAVKRQNFNKLNVKTLSYGSILTSIQAVVDFLLGYELYLKDVGFKFNGYDSANQVAQNWFTSAKEFMYWTKHNWSDGALLTLSPVAQHIELSIAVGVAEDLLDGFYEYKILKSDGTPLLSNYIEVNRDYQSISVKTINTADGIYYFKTHFVLKEHVVVFDDRTVFNDVIYDKTTGYRQDRIKVRGFRTTDWDGDYTSPGFLFDNVNIQPWSPFTDYKLGDIVAYRSYNWTSLQNQPGTEVFDETYWTKLDSTPSKGLVANFDYKINQFGDYYDLDADGVGTSQRALARHAVGYQAREYLQNIAEDDVSQFKIYQGFIREKGTANSITKVFDKLSTSTSESVTLNEEWAFRVGQFGGVDQTTEIEFEIKKDNLSINPQPILITGASNRSVVLDQYIRVSPSDFTIAPLPFTTSIIPTTYELPLTRNAGYVNNTHVDFIVQNKDSILELNIDSFSEGNHVWVTFDKSTWTVLRYTKSQFTIETIVKTGTDIEITLGQRHDFVVDEIIGIDNINYLTGFYKITAVTVKTITVTTAVPNDPEFVDSTTVRVNRFRNARFASYSELDPQAVALLKSGSRLWIDSNEDKLWQVTEKTKQFSVKQLVDYGVTDPIKAGTAVVYVENLKQTISSIPGSGYVVVYAETTTGLVVQQILEPQEALTTLLGNSFGNSLGVSVDNQWLVVGTPLASGIPSNYLGDFDPAASYQSGDVVLYANKLWQAVNSVAGDGSTINVYSQDWIPATRLSAYGTGNGEGFIQQGMITLYLWADQQWNLVESLVSPRPAENEQFGYKVSVNGNYMAISAPGAMNNIGRVYLYTFDGTTWNHLENTNYQGLYDSTGNTFYPAGSIVWWENQMWRALADTTGDGSTITVLSNDWEAIGDISTENSLPTSPSLAADSAGLLDPTSMAELVKEGDKFGSSIAMNGDGSLLVVGSPYSDGQYFANYRGQWKAYQTYVEGDVVKYQAIYYKLNEIESTNDDPSDGAIWVEVGDSTLIQTGKVFVYHRDSNNIYRLIQTITAGSLPSISDITEFAIAAGDEFGFSIDVTLTGTRLVISSPQADINNQNQGSAFVFKTDMVGNPYRLIQRLESYQEFNNEKFGYSVSFSSRGDKIAVGAINSPYRFTTRFDIANGGTYFDNYSTQFSDDAGYTGQVYVFELRDQTYFLTEKLEVDSLDFKPNEGFGSSVDCTSSVIVVGSPTYVPDSSTTTIGRVRLFYKDLEKESWNTIGLQTPLTNLELLKSVAIYDNSYNFKLSDVEVIDPYKLKILGTADQELSFKTPYDPATYRIGTDEQIVDESNPWFEANVGKLWWDISKAKWINYEQGDVSYRIGNWGRLAEGASIGIYEWVESVLLPSEWSALADTTEGIAEGISGQPLYPDDTVYSYKEQLNATTDALVGTLYYYWVQSTSIVPSNNDSRRISAADVAALIENPSSGGTPVISFLGSDVLLAYNFDALIANDTALINIQFNKSSKKVNPVHNEYQLLTEGVAGNVPAEQLEAKWIDSLIGFDAVGNTVPDLNLAAKQKYGVSFRPRQSMFVDRKKALNIVIDRINNILRTQPFADTLNFNNLNKVDPIPSSSLNVYDLVVGQKIDLDTVGTARVRQAILRPTIINGQINSIEIIDPGFGYRTIPNIVIAGDGKNATASLTLDLQGSVNSVTVLTKGIKYSSAIASVRSFAVLVTTDETANNFWSVYSLDQKTKTFYRSKTQGYDTTRYWSYADWWKDGYSITSRIVTEISNFYLEPTILTEVGDLIRVKDWATGGWAVLARVDTGTGTISGNYDLVARENGTIQLSESLYNVNVNNVGYDNGGAYDSVAYDLQPTTELRNIFNAVKNDLFVENLAVEWNNIFFAAIRYAFSEQLYIDWAFKTSFLNAIHNVGSLEQKTNYKNDNLESYKQYIEEVKPYRTTIREFTSLYSKVEIAASAVTDFDLPPAYSITDGKILPISNSYDRLAEYPWKWWVDNTGYSILSIEVAEGGGDYTSPPTVLISGNGTGASAKAYISNGKVSAVSIITQGSGYTSVPTVTLVGGNGSSTNIAKVIAIMGETKTRTFDMGIKFDRLSKEPLQVNFEYSQTFVATQYSSVFELNYAPTRDKSKISIYKNKQVLFPSEYEIQLYTSTVDTYSLTKGKILITADILAGDIIEVLYEKNDSLLSAVDRIEKYYAPTSGMKGKELSQLMTGIDFGGVQVQGTTFDVSGGWDALPWFTDSWDSVSSSSDFYIVSDGSTTSVTLPTTPADGQQISIYIKRNVLTYPSSIDTLGTPAAPIVVVDPGVAEAPVIRIDDPYYSLYDGITVQPNGRTSAPTNVIMDSFIGDGSTRTIELPYILHTQPGDTLIFRNFESDGTVTISDNNIIDTNVVGGTFESTSSGALVAPQAVDGAYYTARGTTSEEIVLNGGKFISPEQVPAPEENVPGQVLDSVSIKVFHSTRTGATPIQSKLFFGNSVTRFYDIGLRITEEQSLIVYVNKVKQNYNISGTSTVDYAIDFVTNQIEFYTAPPTGAIIEIISIGIGGVEILDYQEFTADGVTGLFLTQANYFNTSSVVVTVDGVEVEPGFINSNGVINDLDKTLIQFGIKPSFRQVIKIICLGTPLDTDMSLQSVVRVNQQTIVYDGSTLTYDLDKFVTLSRGSAPASVMVEIEGRELNSVDTTYVIYDGSNNEIDIGVDPSETIGTITLNDIDVYINDIKQQFIVAWTFDGPRNRVTVLPNVLTVNDIIKIETDVSNDYKIVDNKITFVPSVLTENDTITVTWFSEYPTMNIISDMYSGGKANYKLNRTPLDISYVWVYLNKTRLVAEIEYTLDIARRTITLNVGSVATDKLKIVHFSEDVYRPPVAYEIFKDMLNGYHYKRYSIDQVVLTQDLNYYDTEIHLTDTSTLTDPIVSRNIPGMVEINGERIEYMIKTATTLSQLRRGSFGTAIGEVYTAGESVINLGSTEAIPYTETQEKYSFVSDGSSLLIGPLDFTPQQGVRSIWYRSSIPMDFGACDQLEVFVAGTRLRKNPITQYDQSLGASSPNADIQIEAEFSVDGINPYIRLTSAAPAGTRITVMRRMGSLWYSRGETTAATGVTLLANRTPVVDFIAQKSTRLPE